MLTCMQRRRVLSHLTQALVAADEATTLRYARLALEAARRDSKAHAEIASALAIEARDEMLNEIDTLMGVLEIQQAVSAQDRGANQCAAWRYMTRKHISQ